MKLIYENNDLITSNQFETHIKLYQGYIDKVNNIDKRLTKEEISSVDFRSNMESMQYALNGIILHELYFENIIIKNDKDENKEYNIKQRFEEKFQIDYELWIQDFTTLALDTRGWVLFIFEPRTNQYINISLQDHSNGHVSSTIPLIVLDMYEHAFYVDYKNNKKEYIDKFIKNIDWDIVYNRIE